VAFQAGWFKFVLTAVHILFGTETAAGRKKREREIKAITSFLSARAKKEDKSYILLGDFNIPNVKSNLMEALEKDGFSVPDAIKEHPTDLGQTNHYDRIAFNLKLDGTMTVFSENEQKAGAFNFADTVYREQDFDTYKAYFEDKLKDKTEEEQKEYYLSYWRTYQMSDHLPLWVELKVDFSNQYLERLKKQ
jgi:exonuclease III